jgi:hypothetical protein
VTANSTTGYYAKPDTYYHPNYNTTTGADWEITTDFGWTWSWDGAAGGVMPLVKQSNDNYIEVVWGAVAGNYTINVVENLDPLIGTCTSAPTVMEVTVVAEPAIAFTGTAAGLLGNDNTNDPTAVNLEEDREVCSGDFTGIVQATLSGVDNFQFKYSLEIATLAGDHITKEKYWNHAATGTAPTEVGGAPNLAVNKDGAALATAQQAVTATETTFDLLKPADGFIAIKDGATTKSTVYTYKIFGVNDDIARKSHYINNTTKDPYSWKYYDETAEYVVLVVNPAPVTGPIYHISNTWGN